MFTLWITPIKSKIKESALPNYFTIEEGTQSEEIQGIEDSYILLWVDDECVIFEPVFSKHHKWEYFYHRRDFR